MLYELTDYFVPFGTLQVKRDTLFVTVVGLQVKITSTPTTDPGSTDCGYPSAGIAIFCLFDLDYFGTEVGEHRG
jgi:hypothetical protein